MVMKSDQKNMMQCAIVGDGMVGKTRLSLAFSKSSAAGEKPKVVEELAKTADEKPKTSDSQDDEYVATVFDNYAGKATINGDDYSVSIYDSAGEHEYEGLRQFAYRDSEVFVVCFSVVDRDSFDSVRDFWLPEMKHNMSRKKPFILVATQTDLRNTMDYDNDAPVTSEEGSALAKDIGASAFVECSLNEQGSVKEVFTEVVQAGLKFRKRKSNIVHRLLGK